MDEAYSHYLAIFEKRFGDKPEGAFVKHGKVMIKKLSRAEFEGRYSHYVTMRRACEKMLKAGTTISDAIVMEYQDAASWIALEPPDILAMFRGELGDVDGGYADVPDGAKPSR